MADPELLAGEQPVAVDPAGQGHGLLLQRRDDVVVVDDAPRLRVADAGHDGLVDAIGEQFQAIIVDPGQHAMADEPGGHGVEHLLVHEAAGGADGYACFPGSAGGYLR